MSPVSYLALAIGLLLLPLWWLRVSNARLVDFERRGWPSGWRSVLLCIVDPLRAAAGAGLLLHYLPAMERIELFGVWQDPILLASVVTLGLIVQTLAWRDEDFAFAPVLFALGVAAVVAHPIVLAISLPLALGGAFAFRAWAGGFFGGGIGLAVVGLAVEQQEWRNSLLVGVAFFMPILFSVLAGRHLGWPKK